MLNKKFYPICFKNSAQESTVLKNFQLQKDTKVIEGRPLLLKCDSNSLSKFAQDLTRPYDPKITRALIDTAMDLMKYWGATLAYTHSDEIVFLFENVIPKTSNSIELLSVPYGGDINNMLSLFAAKTTLLFNSYLSKDNRIIEKNHRPEDLPCFKAAAFSVPDLSWALQWLAWRQKEGEKSYIDSVYDYISKSGSAKHKKLDGISLKEKISYLNENGFSISDLSLSKRYGTFILKKKEMKFFSPEELENIPEEKRPKGPVLRSIFVEQEFDLISSTPDCFEQLFNPLSTKGDTQ